MTHLLALALIAAAPFSGEALRINQLQVIGTHNSYKLAIEPALMRRLLEVSPAATELDYAHAPLSKQLDWGLRSLELDVLNDPEGGHYATPIGLRMLREEGEETAVYDPRGQMKRPGFKVLHVPDIDFRSNCLTLDDALAELRGWSGRNAGHVPVVITVNLKDEPADFPGATHPVPFDAAALDSLDEALRHGLGDDRLVTPDRVRGDAETLEQAILTRGWPELESVRGRFLWVLDEGGEKAATYIDGHPSLSGRVCFTTLAPGQPESAFMIMNDPVAQGSDIRRRVQQGYLVRTRADAGTAESRAGDRARFAAARNSGAQVISTDYPRPDERHGTGYRVVFRDGTYARTNPVTCNAKAAQAP